MRHEKEIEIENKIEKATMKVQLSLCNKIFHFSKTCPKLEIRT